MAGGFTGRIAYVDLSNGTTRVEDLDRRLMRDYIGSTAINARLLAEIGGPRGTTWDADNPIVVGVGPLVGTLVPGASRTSITTRSPITGGYGTSNSGSFGDGLKAAGFDHLVITGVASEPVVIVCDEGTVRIESAADAWGLDIYDATDLLGRRFPASTVACIGPAGEHGVAGATVITDKHGAFGSSGLGCAFGIKRLKAIVARGTATVTVHDRSRFTRSALRLFRDLMAQPHIEGWRQWGTLIQFTAENGPGSDEARHDFGFDIDAWLEVYRSRIWEGPATCPGCPVGCKARIRNGDHTIQISCPTGSLSLHFAMFPGVSPDRYEGVVRNAETANRLGISTIWAGQLLDWVTAMIDAGDLKEGDCDGWQPGRGDPAATDRLMEVISHRIGIGDALADPIPEARTKLGVDATAYPDRKGMLMLGYGSRSGPAGLARWNGYTFSRVVDPRGPVAETAYSSIVWAVGRTEEQLTAYARRIGIPDDRIDSVVTGGTDGYDIARLTPYVEAYNQVIYAIGQCNRPYFARVMPLDRIADLLEAATGIAWTGEDLRLAGERTMALLRIYNGAFGLDRNSEVGPEAALDPVAGAELEGLLDRYYEEHGWNPSGRPRPERLAELGLDGALERSFRDQANLVTNG